MSPVRAPYNFVPFHTGGGSGTSEETRAEKVLLRYPDIAELPRHDVIDPGLKTGEIHVTIRAETPVFVSDGNGHFFRDANKKFTLPGSTIRGMTRENMQILGFGTILPGEDLDDYQIYFRDVASAGNSTGGPLKKYYHDAMGTKTLKNQNQRFYSIPQNVKAGYLRKKGDAYYIQPVKGSYIRVSRKNPALEEDHLKGGEAMTVKVVYTIANGQVKSIRRGDGPVPGMEQGVLLYTGKAPGEKRKPAGGNARYLFPAADEKAAPVAISKEDRISYQEDLENRKNILGKRWRFWALPQAGKEKPVFYIRHNGHVYFGMSLFLRIGYSHRLSDGLPVRRPERQRGRVPLDYVHAVLGFAEKDRSYRSRVSFGDFTALGNPEEGPAAMTILGQPKPGWYAGYVEGGKNYNEDGFLLRGYKFYWFKEASIAPAPAGRETVRSILRPLPAGTEFRGVIRYKNLHPDELGLLLWALRLEEGCYQSVGMGKPYGLGRVSLTIDALAEYDALALYRPDNLCRIPTAEDRDSADRYIRAFDGYICDRLRIGRESPSIRNEPVIRDFFFIRSVILTGAEAGYMKLNEYKNIRNALPDIRAFRQETGGTRADAGT